MMQISAIIPTYNRPMELRACLEGFAAQTAPRESFEVIVIDDGSAETMEPLVTEFAGAVNVVFRRIPNSGQSVARNLAIDTATAPLLLLYDDDLSPREGLIEYCLAFHASWPGEGHMSLLRFRPDPAIRDEPLMRWAFPRMYPFPAASRTYGTFWAGTLTCKKSIFRFGRFNPDFRALEDMELEIRLARRLDLNIHFERRIMSLYTRPLTLPQFLGRTYIMAYYDCRLAFKYRGIYGGEVPFEPERHLIPAGERQGLLAATTTLLAKRPTPGSAVFQMLAALLMRAESHARADGWLAARDGASAEPPGTLRPYLTKMKPGK
jgi:glycosyltransferase involved in cell wall biosynthesis